MSTQEMRNAEGIERTGGTFSGERVRIVREALSTRDEACACD